MIPVKNTISIMLLLVVMCISLQAQADESLPHFEDTTKKYEQIIRYLDLNMNNEKSVFKASVPILSLGYKKIGTDPELDISYKYLLFELQLAYERKMGKSFSFFVYNISNYSRAHISGFETMNEPDKYNRFYNAFDLGFRYYYKMRKRMRQGLSGNNMFGSYMGFAVEGISKVQMMKNKQYDLYKPDGYRFNIGVQNRLNSWSFVDVSFYIKYDPLLNHGNPVWDSSMGVNLKIGLTKSYQ